MVRLVFRPYTQIRRTICTSVSLRASTRVSPGFTLFRHRSPSFGSQHICSLLKSFASERSVDSASHPRAGFLPHGRSPLYFHCASGFVTQILAYMLDSLVRVSRRVVENHFVTSRTQQVTHPRQYSPFAQTELCSLTRLGKQTSGVPYSEECGLSLSSFRPNVGRQGLNQSEERHQPQHFLQRI